MGGIAGGRNKNETESLIRMGQEQDRKGRDGSERRKKK